MPKKIALLAPFALIVGAAACGAESPSATGQDEEGTPQANSAEEALVGTGDGVADEDVETSESELRGGAVRGGGVAVGARGGAVGGRRVAVGGRGGVVGGGGFVVGGRRVGVARGWVGGRWAPGWGWSNGHWVVGATAQYTCVTDVDCAGPLGPGVAICSYDPTSALGYCIAPSW